MKTQTGLDILAEEKSAQALCKGNIGYICHNASCSSDLRSGIEIIKNIFQERLVALFSPQHGIFADVQANMIETDSSTHPYFNLPIHSLYGESRVPTKEMLTGIDTLIFDLQDVGAVSYTHLTLPTICSV